MKLKCQKIQSVLLWPALFFLEAQSSRSRLRSFNLQYMIWSSLFLKTSWEGTGFKMGIFGSFARSIDNLAAPSCLIADFMRSMRS